MMQIKSLSISKFCLKMREMLEGSALHIGSESSNYCTNFTWIDCFLDFFNTVKGIFEEECIADSLGTVSSSEILDFLNNKNSCFGNEQWARIILKSGYTYVQTGSYVNTANVLETVFLEKNIPIEVKDLMGFIPKRSLKLKDFEQYLGSALYNRAELFTCLQQKVDEYVAKHRFLPNSIDSVLTKEDATLFSHTPLTWVMHAGSGEILTQEALKRRSLKIKRDLSITAVTPYKVQKFSNPSDIIGELHVRVPSQQTESS